MKNKKKIIGIISVAIIVIIAVATGILTYNNSDDIRLKRQLDLGNRYLAELNYEEAIVAYEEAIEIDERCLEAYVGSIKAYIGIGDVDSTQDFYDRTLLTLSGMDEDFLTENMNYAVEIYLEANKVYEDSPDRIVSVLEEGYTATKEDSRIRNMLIENYILTGQRQMEGNSYEEALIVYERLLELDSANADILNNLRECLNQYSDMLMANKQYNRIRELALKYTDADSEMFSEKIAEIEVIEAAEDADLLDLLNSENNYMKDLMECLAWYADDDIENVNAMLQGTREGAEWMIEAGVPKVLYCTELWRLLEKQGWHMDNDYCVITEKQAEDLFYAICGKRMEFDGSDYENWSEPYLWYLMSTGFEFWYDADNFSVERVDDNTWNVRAIMKKYSNIYSAETKVCRSYFTVVRNQESFFEGYSLTGYKIEEDADKGWAKIYYDYLTTDPNGMSLMEDHAIGWQGGEYEWDLVYVDDDMVPELYLKGLYMAAGDVLLYLSDGKVAEKYLIRDGGSYIPFTGIWWEYAGHMGDIWVYGYYLSEGKLTSEYYCGGGLAVPDPDDVSYRVLDNEVTKEQFEEILNGRYEGLGSATVDLLLNAQITSENFRYELMGNNARFVSVLDYLQYIMSVT